MEDDLPHCFLGGRALSFMARLHLDSLMGGRETLRLNDWTGALWVPWVGL